MAFDYSGIFGNKNWLATAQNTPHHINAMPWVYQQYSAPAYDALLARLNPAPAPAATSTVSPLLSMLGLDASAVAPAEAPVEPMEPLSPELQWWQALFGHSEGGGE